METRISAVSPRDVHFTPRDSGSHAFEDPQLSMDEPTSTRIQEAARLLERDEAIAFPTETVYGLGANGLSDRAIGKIYAAKNRPSDNPLILHIASLSSLRKLLQDASLPSIYVPLISKFWPGPLTILLPLNRKTSQISELCTSGQETFAVRMPESTLALALLHTVGFPLAAPSANTSTRPSPTTAQHVFHDLTGRIPLILDGGSCEVGVESTVVDGLVSPPELLRPGGITLEQLRNVPGWEKTVVHRAGVKDDKEVPRTPGMKYRHYSPTARIILFENTAAAPDCTFLADQGISDDAKVAICRTRAWPSTLASSLGSSISDHQMGTSGESISRRLFALLRELDEHAIDVILIEGIAEDKQGLAVMNRLRKAASLIFS